MTSNNALCDCATCERRGGCDKPRLSSIVSVCADCEVGKHKEGSKAK